MTTPGAAWGMERDFGKLAALPGGAAAWPGRAGVSRWAVVLQGLGCGG